ncbi:MAG: hypothetical protein U0228_32700 [Myxococcaceae bacterium]
MALDIEPLLTRIAQLAPMFGRAEGDLQAMVSRGRSQDYKGVMQNARLVLEALLRSLVTEELKQTPGKAMLDELVTKFRQQANAGIIPTNVLAHMGTVQAWGNLSAHDHAGSLDDSGVKVGQDEVIASLNSMVAILSWYAEKKGLSAAAPANIPRSSGSSPGIAPPGSTTGSAPALVPVAPVAPTQAAPAPGGSKVPLIAGAAVVVVIAVVAAVKFGGGSGPGTTEQPVKPPPVTDAFGSLDGVYKGWDEPPPPAACRRAEDAKQVADAVNDPQALGLIDKPSAEISYLIARATFFNLKRKSPAIDEALKCPGFAAAEHLAGLLSIAEDKIDDALKHFIAARAAAPTWLENRSKVAGVLLQQQKLDDAAKEIDGMIGARPDYAPAYLLRFSLKVLQGDKAGATVDLCKAVKLGSSSAAAKAKEAGATCD